MTRRFLLTSAAALLLAAPLFAQEGYPHRGHVKAMVAARVTSHDGTPLTDWQVRFCLVEDGRNRAYTLDRTLDPSTPLFLNGRQFDPAGCVGGQKPHEELVRWWVFTGPCKAETRPDGGWNLTTLDGRELADYMALCNASLTDRQIISNCFGNRLRTIDECRELWRREWAGEIRWDFARGVYVEVPAGQRRPLVRPADPDPTVLPLNRPDSGRPAFPPSRPMAPIRVRLGRN